MGKIRNGLAVLAVSSLGAFTVAGHAGLIDDPLRQNPENGGVQYVEITPVEDISPDFINPELLDEAGVHDGFVATLNEAGTALDVFVGNDEGLEVLVSIPMEQVFASEVNPNQYTIFVGEGIEDHIAITIRRDDTINDPEADLTL